MTDPKGAAADDPVAPPPSTVPAQPDLEGQAALTAAEQATKAQLAAGTDYTDTFTLTDALKDYNATRKAGFMNGQPVDADSQRIERDATWHVDHAGSFKLRQPGFYDELSLRTRVAELTRGAPVDDMTQSMCEATAVVELLLVGRPPWFDLTKVTDEIVPLMIYHWYMHWQKRFRRRG